MEKKWIITFSNGHYGCDIEKEFVGTYEKAVEFANDYLSEYTEFYGWSERYTEEGYDECLENCGYDIKESEKDE